MTRIGKKPIPIPKEVKVKLDGTQLTVSGPKGELKREIHPKVQVQVGGEQITVSATDQSKETKSLHGLFKVLIANMVNGVSKGFQKEFEIAGVGYRVEVKGRTAVFNLGYSAPINFDLPEGIEASVEKNKLTLTGIDKELLGHTAAKMRGFREPEPYKGKGIKYAAETVRRKAGKAGGS
jgi:large subunit ribosomal protein L6